MNKKFIFVLMMTTVLSANLRAESWSCGTDCTANLVDGTLTISGKGEMTNYDGSYTGSAPWADSIGSITSIVVEEGITSIGDTAFYAANNLTSLTIPNSVKSIGENAFRYAGSLTSLTIPNSVKSIGEHAFDNATSLTSLTIPNSVTSIGTEAFSNATSLTSLTIPDSVTSIGDGAFMGATSLTSLTIPDSVTSIGMDAFKNASSLTSLTIPDSVTSIGSSAFSGATSLTSLTIPDSVETIGEGAFGSLSGLTNITVSDSNLAQMNLAELLDNNSYGEGFSSYGQYKVYSELLELYENEGMDAYDKMKPILAEFYKIQTGEEIDPEQLEQMGMNKEELEADLKEMLPYKQGFQEYLESAQPYLEEAKVNLRARQLQINCTGDNCQDALEKALPFMYREAFGLNLENVGNNITLAYNPQQDSYSGDSQGNGGTGTGGTGDVVETPSAPVRADKRIYTIDEANQVAGKINTFKIRYR